MPQVARSNAGNVLRGTHKLDGSLRRVASLVSVFTLTAGCAFSVASSAVGASQASGTKVVSASLRLDWTPTGYQAPFFVAKHFGWYKKAGINLSISPGNGITTMKQVASGKDTFGFGTVPNIATIDASDNDNLVSVCGFFQSDPSAIISLKSNPISKITQLYGKRLGRVVGGTSLPLTAFLTAAHVDRSKFSIVDLTFSDYLSSLATGKVTALYNWGPTQGAEENAIKPIAHPLYAYKYLAMLSSAIFATRSTIAKEPNLVRGLVKATIRAIGFSIAHPSKALQIMHSYDPTMTMNVNKTAIEDLHQFMHTSNSKGHSYCWVSPKDVASTQHVLRKYDDLSTSVIFSKIVTNKFVPAAG